MSGLIIRFLASVFIVALTSCGSTDSFYVDAGADQTVQTGAAATLVGTADSPDGSITSYEWTQISGEAVTLTGENTSSASFTAPIVAIDVVLTFQLIVNDSRGGRATDDVNVFVTVLLPVDPENPIDLIAPSSIAGETIRMTITSGAGSFSTTGTYTVSISANQDIYTVTGDGVNVGNSAGNYTYSANNNIGVISIIDSVLGAGAFALTFTSTTSGTFAATVASDPASNQAGTFTRLSPTPTPTPDVLIPTRVSEKSIYNIDSSGENIMLGVGASGAKFTVYDSGNTIFVEVNNLASSGDASYGEVQYLPTGNYTVTITSVLDYDPEVIVYNKSMDKIPPSYVKGESISIPLRSAAFFKLTLNEDATLISVTDKTKIWLYNQDMERIAYTFASQTLLSGNYYALILSANWLYSGSAAITW